MLGIAIGLSCDAFAVSVVLGSGGKRVKLSEALRIAWWFGIMQAIMPMIGWGVCRLGGTLSGGLSHIFAFAVLSGMGIKMIIEFFRWKTDLQNHTTYKVYTLWGILMLAVSVSLDALAVGILLPSVFGCEKFLRMILAVGIIGGTAFVMSFVGVCLGEFFGKICSHYARLFGGILLLLTGLKIFICH